MSRNRMVEPAPQNKLVPMTEKRASLTENSLRSACPKSRRMFRTE